VPHSGRSCCRSSRQALRLADVGRREEALATAEEAATIRRRLAEDNPAAYLPDLAKSLNNLAIRHCDFGV
jgi:hypothetical protein